MSTRSNVLLAAALAALAACSSGGDPAPPPPAPPAIVSFEAADDLFTSGGATTLTAVFSGGTATIAPGVGAVESGVPVSTGALAASTTFTLTVTGADGASATATETVTVVPPPVISSFAPVAAAVLEGTGTDLVATFSGGTGVVSPGVGAVTSGVPVPTGALTATARWTLTVTNAAGDAATADATVTVEPPPAIALFAAAAGRVPKGEATTLTAVFSGGTATIAPGVGAVASGVPAATPALDAATTFTLTVTGLGGAVATATVTVEVADCANGARDGDEEGVDCGGACGACPADCAAILAARPGAADGAYDIDPDGAGGAPALRAWCDMTTDGGGYTLCASHAHGASGDGLGYLTATWGTDAGPFLDGAAVVRHGSFCGALSMSKVFAAHFTDATTERFRTAPIPTGGENPFAEPFGRHRYEEGANVLGVITKDAMAKWVLAGTACQDEDNGPPQGSALCFSDGTRWQLVVGNLNNYQYSGEMEWMCQPNAYCGWPTGSESVLVFAR